MKKNILNSKEIDRREFLKRLGMGTAAVSTLSLASCGSGKSSTMATGSELGEIPTDQMTYRTNHNTGDKVSILGYGCMRWPTMPDPEGGNDIIDQEMVNKLVDYAIEHGVNYFDTAPVYCRGKSEEATGIALKRHPRDSYYIATKMSNFSVAGKDLSPKETFDSSVKLYHDSLKKLQTDYIDYYLLHSVGGGDGINTLNERFIDNGLLDYLMKEREAGRIRNLGFSYHGDVAVFDYLLANHDKYKWDFVQIQMNYLDWQHAKEIHPSNTDAAYLYGELEKRNIPVVIMEPLLVGRLSNVPDHVVARLKQKEPDRSVASWAFRFAGTYPEVLTVLSGMTYMEHLQDNLRSYCPLKPLSEDEINYLHDTASVIVQYPTVPCTDCKYCMPCPYGIDIPAIFAHYNKCVNQGQVAESSQADNYREARKAFLVGYDRSVPKLRQASHCIGCNQCGPHCPQNIKIPKQLQRIDKYVEELKQNTV